MGDEEGKTVDTEKLAAKLAPLEERKARPTNRVCTMPVRSASARKA